MIAYTGVSDENTGVPRSICPYISIKGAVMHVVTPTEESKLKTFICGRMYAYDKYGRYKPLWVICMDVVEKVRKGINYDDTLHQGS